MQPCLKDGLTFMSKASAGDAASAGDWKGEALLGALTGRSLEGRDSALVALPCAPSACMPAAGFQQVNMIFDAHHA